MIPFLIYFVTWAPESISTDGTQSNPKAHSVRNTIFRPTNTFHRSGSIQILSDTLDQAITFGCLLGVSDSGRSSAPIGGARLVVTHTGAQVSCDYEAVQEAVPA